MMQLSKFNTRLIQIFLILSILFFCGFGYMLITKEVIPALKNNDSPQFENTSISYSISEIRIYKNDHFVKNDLDVSHQYWFSLNAVDDKISYISSQASESVLKAPFVSKFETELTPKIPHEKMNNDFYLVYSENGEKELSRFPAFRFADYLTNEAKNSAFGKHVEVKQTSTDGKMMVYMILNFEYQ